MQKKFLKNLLLLLFLNLLVKPLWIFGIDRQVQNLVGPEDYGFYFTVFNYSFLFFIFLDLGLTNFNNRNIAQNNQLLTKHLAGIGTVKLLLGLLYGLLIFLVAWIYHYGSEFYYLLLWIGFNQFLLSFILYLRSNLNGLLLFRTDSVISVLDRLLMIMILGFLLWTGWFDASFSIRWFVYGQTVAYVITTLVALVAVLNKAGRLRLNWNWPFIVMIVKKSLPFASLVLIMSFYNRIDPVLIQRLIPGAEGNEQVGVYSQAFRLLDAGQNFSYLFAVLLLPLFAAMLSRKESVEQLVKLSASILISGTFILAFAASVYSEQLMALLYTRMPTESMVHYTHRIQQSATIFSVLMISFMAISSNYIFGTLLTANNNLRLLNLVALGGLTINLTLNFVLIPRFMSVGSAWAGMSAQVFTAIVQLILVIRIFRFKANYRFIGALAALVAGMVLMHMGLLQWPGLDWKYRFLILLLAGLTWSVVLRLISIRGIVALIKGSS